MVNHRILTRLVDQFTAGSSEEAANISMNGTGSLNRPAHFQICQAGSAVVFSARAEWLANDAAMMAEQMPLANAWGSWMRGDVQMTKHWPGTFLKGYEFAEQRKNLAVISAIALNHSGLLICPDYGAAILQQINVQVDNHYRPNIYLA